MAAACAITGFAVAAPVIAREVHAVQRDRRVVADRLGSHDTPSPGDDSFLNAVGAVWPYDVIRSAAGYPAATGVVASTGFLIDPCHVLTSLHVLDPEGATAPAGTALGSPVTFAVGETASDQDKGALQGLKFLYHGRFVAHGQSRTVGGRVVNPENDWAVIRLGENVDTGIEPMRLAAPALESLPRGLTLSAAGFPTDHRARNRDGFRLKQLWKSDGVSVGAWLEGGGALIATTLQTTPGNSGGPIYATIAGRPHAVIGIVESTRGNGIDVSETEPNAQVLFTPDTLARINSAQALNPCR